MQKFSIKVSNTLISANFPKQEQVSPKKQMIAKIQGKVAYSFMVGGKTGGSIWKSMGVPKNQSVTVEPHLQSLL